MAASFGRARERRCDQQAPCQKEWSDPIVDWNPKLLAPLQNVRMGEVRVPDVRGESCDQYPALAGFGHRHRRTNIVRNTDLPSDSGCSRLLNRRFMSEHSRCLRFTFLREVRLTDYRLRASAHQPRSSVRLCSTSKAVRSRRILRCEIKVRFRDFYALTVRRRFTGSKLAPSSR